jgi:ABC-2 type transport system permease protein
MKISNIMSRRNRILLRELVITDFKLRYQGSILGYLWSLLKPLFMFAILYVVFGMLVRLGTIEHYPVYLLLGIVLWTFFAEATNQGLMSIVERGDLLRKISFPKYIVVVATTISALINLMINLVVVAVFMFFNGVELQASAIFFPFYILEIYSIALALAFLLSALNVKYRDVSHIWEIIMQAAFYATPIIYPLSVVVDKSLFAAKLLMLSPVAQAIQDARYALITHQSITTSSLYGKAAYVLVPLSIIVILVVAAVIYFKKSQAYFAENI